ncbi:MAG: LysR family transcriptional regulator [Halobacteriovoraceae bacterium]|jgi:DNA-binding transcriptional LysR family regulator|nr:LysR family transcriptional regulator [Halobacteriovoraceae bacterium]MBT5093297.1 LysR family transcriptional regulator [Halobacteriovoraceae bacterium]
MQPLQKEYLYFLTLCETNNISHAAERLAIGQGALSKSLKRLEQSLQTQLFIRKGRGLKPTSFAKLLEQQLLAMKQSWQQDFLGKSESLNELHGHFKIGAHSIIAMDLVREFYPKLCEKYSELNLEMVLDVSAGITKMVIDFEIDFGFSIQPIPHPDLVIQKVRKEYVSVWSKSSSPKEKVVYYSPDMFDVSKMLKKYKGHKHIAVQDYDVLASFASNSNGLTILPSPVARRHKGLVSCGPKLQEVDVCLIYRVDRPKTAGFRTVLGDIKKLIC